jgi:predicted transcriptional regulator
MTVEPSGDVFRVERKRGSQWYAKHRLPDGRQVQRHIGPAWSQRGFGTRSSETVGLLGVSGVRPVSNFERVVLEQLWTLGRAPVRAVLDALNEDESRSPRAYTTVLTIVQRLQHKELVRRVREGRVDLYEPTVTRAEYLSARAAAEVDGLVGEYGEYALVQFARRTEQLDAATREQLRRIAEE